MSQIEILGERLERLKLASSRSTDVAELVRWLGAVQAQDFGGAKWALGLRLNGVTEADIDQAFNDGVILRTHVLRPTWHFVAPEDIRWMLELTGPRIESAVATYVRGTDLTAPVLARTNAILAEALKGHNYLTRAECEQLFVADGIAMRMGPEATNPSGHIMMHAEVTGLVCSGPMRGKQHTFALLDERVPNGRSLSRDEAIAELAQLYLQSRAPATVKDFAWWSGLTATEVAPYFEAVQAGVVEASGQLASPTAWLLPNYDEYLVAYADRSAAAADVPADKLDSRGNILFQNVLVIDGLVEGTWKRSLKSGTVEVIVTVFHPLTSPQMTAVKKAAQDYGTFLGRTATLTWQ